MYITQLIKSLKPTRREHWLMLCILIYAINNVLKYYASGTIHNTLTMLCGIAFICILFFNIHSNPLKGLTKYVYGILSLWTILLTLRMIFIDDVRSTFTEYYGWSTWVLAFSGSQYLLPNLLPLTILMFPHGYRFDFMYLWRTMWLLCICYLCYYPFALWSITHYSWSFEMTEGMEWGEEGTYGGFISNSTIGIANLAPTAIMLFFKKYLKTIHWHWFMIAYIGSLIITIFLARRGDLALSLLYLVLAWLMYSLFDKRTSPLKLLFIGVIAVGISYLLFTNTADSLFSTLIERGAEDSRSDVEDSFYADMKTLEDWLFGRGWFGQYYEPNFGIFRNAIETGYLVLILRGGFLYLIPYVVTLFLTFFNGIFRSRNLFCKTFAIICLMQIISLYPSGWPAFNFFHMIIWLGVWICNSKQIRQMDDVQIKHFYFNPTL